MVRRIARALAASTVALALAGCPAEHPGYPDRSCKVSPDCFHDEICSNNLCISVDAGTPDMAIVDFAAPPFDQLGDAE